MSWVQVPSLTRVGGGPCSRKARTGASAAYPPGGRPPDPRARRRRPLFTKSANRGLRGRSPGGRPPDPRGGLRPQTRTPGTGPATRHRFSSANTPQSTKTRTGGGCRCGTQRYTGAGAVALRAEPIGAERRSAKGLLAAGATATVTASIPGLAGGPRSGCGSPDLTGSDGGCPAAGRRSPRRGGGARGGEAEPAAGRRRWPGASGGGAGGPGGGWPGRSRRRLSWARARR
jgi:hypothetical protein